MTKRIIYCFKITFSIINVEIFLLINRVRLWQFEFDIKRLNRRIERQWELSSHVVSPERGQITSELIAIEKDFKTQKKRIKEIKEKIYSTHEQMKATFKELLAIFFKR